LIVFLCVLFELNFWNFRFFFVLWRHTRPRPFETIKNRGHQWGGRDASCRNQMYERFCAPGCVLALPLFGPLRERGIWPLVCPPLSIARCFARVDCLRRRDMHDPRKRHARKKTHGNARNTDTELEPSTKPGTEKNTQRTTNEKQRNETIWDEIKEKTKRPRGNAERERRKSDETDR
jgi:hypothetical protein